VQKILPVFVLTLLFVVGSEVLPQSPNASIRGIVLDPDAKAVPEAEIIVVNDATAIQYQTKTNGEGIYAVENLPPGPYRVQVSKFGFKAIIKPDITLNVQDALLLNFTLVVGASSVVVTVEGGAPMINTTDASVSTVVDRTFVENMPLNGRSFQDLILLAPGVVTNSPQAASGIGYSGEFSVNGQRTESNYYSVDGVGANVGVTSGLISSPSSSGSLPVSTALGTTQGLVSVDALQEFRVQTSSYSAEFGRSPGGQFSFSTRSGTNQWRGTLFDYVRNDVFDANDWFNNYYGQRKPAERQNDFGGTLGGPIEIPGVYDGKDRTFFFFSYEGLRLSQPQASSVSYVPTPALRESAPAALQPALNAFPLPDCGARTSNCQNDLGNGLGEFVGTWSNPSSINSYSLRLDHNLTHNETLFFRFSDTGSAVGARNGGAFETPSAYNLSSFRVQTYTAGLTSLLLPELSNSLRFNYTSNILADSTTLTAFGGATPVDLFALQGIQNGTAGVIEFVLFLPGSAGYTPALPLYTGHGEQKQWNVVDSVSFGFGRHRLKFGIDYRRLYPGANAYNPFLEYVYESQSSVQSNTSDILLTQKYSSVGPVFENFSAFVQDEWRATPRLTLSMGLRWDVNPPLRASKAQMPYTVEGGSYSDLVLAPQGTPLWDTSWCNLAPRIGIAYMLSNAPGHETVIRAGGGIFFDTGQQLGALGYAGPGFSAEQAATGLAFPAPLAQVIPPIVNPPVPPYGTVYAFPTHLQTPYTWQASASLEQALGNSQVIRISYVGGFGRKLLEQNERELSSVNPNFTAVEFLQNGLTSDYNALQLQYQRRMSRGLQVLASYTYSHSIDYGSENTSFPYVRGNSDFDVRHSFSAALSYDLPGPHGSVVEKALLGGWSLDDRFTARTGFPVTLLGEEYLDPATLKYQYLGLDVVPREPVYSYGAEYPGGRAINAGAFEAPPPGQIGDAPRNFARGFGAWQMDLAIRREFHLTERLRLQFRAEAFNTFNHPNFGVIDANFGDPTFGQATATLAQSLGTLSPLYQMGGPRSLQFALKLAF
jgi:carboxypeptidase family protein/TonB-dependent receptor-like protein